MKHRIVTFCMAGLLAAMAVMHPVAGTGAAPASRSGNTHSPCSLPLVMATPVASPVAATPVVGGAEAGTERLAGLLGGSLDSWVAAYGEGGDGSTESTQVYLWKGCGPGSQTTFANGVAVWISLWSHRPEDIAAGKASESDDQNWSQDDALVIAKKLLPSDAVLEKPTTTDQGNIKIHGTSAIMSEDVGWDTYGIAGVSSTPGEFEILMTLDPDGRVYELDVALRGYTVG
ncbi:MAG: hypothetical protein QM589_03490 [Thermomicrobiales bacterium]